MTKLDAKDVKLMCRFRNNARESLTTASRSTGIPVSTIYDKLQKYQGNLVRKHTMLLDFAKLGYAVKVMSIVSVHRDDRDAVQKLLSGHPNVNSLYRTSSGQDFIVEGIFKDLTDYADFTELVDRHNVLSRSEFYIIQDIKQEGFLTDETFDVHLLS